MSEERFHQSRDGNLKRVKKVRKNKKDYSKDTEKSRKRFNLFFYLFAALAFLGLVSFFAFDMSGRLGKKEKEDERVSYRIPSRFDKKWKKGGVIRPSKRKGQKKRRSYSLDEFAGSADFSVGQFALKTKNYDEARKRLQSAIDRKYKEASALMYIGISYGMEKNYEEALKHFERAHELDPKNALILSNWAELDRSFKNSGAALEKMKKAVELRPLNVIYLAKVELIKVELGQGSEVEKIKEGQPFWYIVKTAQALEKKETEKARQNLAQAKRALSPQIFHTLIRDYYFLSKQEQPELQMYFEN